MTFKPVRPLTDAEEVRIQAGIAADPDSPEQTEAEMADLRPFGEVCPDLMAAIKRARGRPKLESPKEAVTLRLSPETIARFKAEGGKEWRARMTDVLDRASGH